MSNSSILPKVNITRVPGIVKRILSDKIIQDSVDRVQLRVRLSDNYSSISNIVNASCIELFTIFL